MLKSSARNLSVSSSAKYWLLKAEPDPRIVKGNDVKVSVNNSKEGIFLLAII